MSDQISYTIAGDHRIRRGPRTLVGTRAWRIQGCREVKQPEPAYVAPIQVQEEVIYALPEKDFAEPKNKGGRPRKQQDHADQA